MKRAAIAACILLLCVGLAWAFGLLGRGDRVAQIKDIQDQLKDKNLSDTDRRALFSQMREKMRGLPDEQRAQVAFGRNRGGGGWRGDADITKVIAMTGADLNKELDKEIDRQLERLKQQGGNAQGGNGNGPPGGPGQGGGGGRGGRGGGNDPNNPNARRDRMLSSVPADARASRTVSREIRQVYNNLVQNRAQQRGVTLPQTGGGMGGGGGRRGG